MRMNRDERLGMRAEDLTALAREDGTEMTVRQRAHGFQRLKAKWQARSRRRGGLVPLVVTLSAMIATLTLVAAKLGMFSNRESSLSYELHGGRIDKNGAIEGEPLERPTLRFSDGTEVALSPGSRARLQSVHGHGARIDLDGQAEVRVVHWPGAQWLFDAGPFLIQVKGTEFVADWKKTEEQLEVRLVKGSVAVSGPVLQDPIILHAGQKLTIHVREKEVLIRDIDSPAAAAPESAAESGWIAIPTTTPSPAAESRAGCEAVALVAAAGEHEPYVASVGRRARERKCGYDSRASGKRRHRGHARGGGTRRHRGSRRCGPVSAAGRSRAQRVEHAAASLPWLAMVERCGFSFGASRRNWTKTGSGSHVVRAVLERSTHGGVRRRGTRTQNDGSQAPLWR